MRKVLSSHSEVAHYWANRTTSEGRAGNMFFCDGKIYSYGSHFCIARILPSGTVAFTTRDYSVSTSKHKSIAQSAARHLAIVYCSDPADSARQNMERAREAVRQALVSSGAPRIRQATRDAHKARALRIAENANAYLAALPEDERLSLVRIDTSALEAVRADLERAEEARRKIEAEARAARTAELAESLAEWRAGSVIARSGFHSIAPALRVSADGSTVQTSHGAEIPMDDARKLWPLILQMRAGQREFSPGEPVGHYRLSKIRKDGSIVVGCHDIAFSEIERIAHALGLLETEGA